MKNLSEFILEKFGNDVLPKDFMDIWKGKYVNIDMTTINPEYFISGVMNVHKDKLPTEKEFENLCEWLAENTSWSKESYDNLFYRMIETFLDVYEIKEISFLDNYPIAINRLRKDKLLGETNQLLVITFFLMKHKSFKPEFFDEVSNYFEKAFKKYRVNFETWPDYSIGLDILRNNI